MKRIACLLCALLLLPLAGCRAGDDPEFSVPPTQETVQTPAPPPESKEPEPLPTPTPLPYFHPLTGLPCEEDLSGRRPAAVMLNNLKSALPQQGNGQADIIYEVLAEGGITRMLAVYQDPSRLGLIGSVRSARQYYWEIAQGHDAVYIHAGGSPEFYNTKYGKNLFTVDGVSGKYSDREAGMFWRDRGRIPGHHYDVEHSLLTSGKAITDMLANEGRGEHSEGYRYEMTFADNGMPPGGIDAAIVNVPFSSYKTGVFRYHEDTGLYLVEEYDEPYIDGNDGSQVAVTNVLVLQTTIVVLDDAGRVRVELSAGKGWFACGGRMIPIRWEKGGSNEQFRYFNEAGEPLTLGRGKSYVCITPVSQTVTAQ